MLTDYVDQFSNVSSSHPPAIIMHHTHDLSFICIKGLSRMFRRFCLLALLVLSVLFSWQVRAATQYTYDEAGRLIKVVYDNGKGIAYFYDDADNRQAVAIDDAADLPTTPPTQNGGGGVIVVPLNGFTVIPLN